MRGLRWMVDSGNVVAGCGLCAMRGALCAMGGVSRWFLILSAAKDLLARVPKQVSRSFGREAASG